MTGVLDLETVATERNGGETTKNTWLLRLPNDICDREGFAEGTLVSLTVKDGGIQTSFIQPPSKKLREISREILEKDREFNRRLKEIGD